MTYPDKQGTWIIRGSPARTSPGLLQPRRTSISNAVFFPRLLTEDILRKEGLGHYEVDSASFADPDLSGLSFFTK